MYFFTYRWNSGYSRWVRVIIWSQMAISTRIGKGLWKPGLTSLLEDTAESKTGSRRLRLLPLVLQLDPYVPSFGAPQCVITLKFVLDVDLPFVKSGYVFMSWLCCVFMIFGVTNYKQTCFTSRLLVWALPSPELLVLLSTLAGVTSL